MWHLWLRSVDVELCCRARLLCCCDPSFCLTGPLLLLLTRLYMLLGLRLCWTETRLAFMLSAFRCVLAALFPWFFARWVNTRCRERQPGALLIVAEIPATRARRLVGAARSATRGRPSRGGFVRAREDRWVHWICSSFFRFYSACDLLGFRSGLLGFRQSTRCVSSASIVVFVIRDARNDYLCCCC